MEIDGGNVSFLGDQNLIFAFQFGAVVQIYLAVEVDVNFFEYVS